MQSFSIFPRFPRSFSFSKYAPRFILRLPGEGERRPRSTKYGPPFKRISRNDLWLLHERLMGKLESPRPVLCHQKNLGSSEPERQARGRLSPRLALGFGNA